MSSFRPLFACWHVLLPVITWDVRWQACGNQSLKSVLLNLQASYFCMTSRVLCAPNPAAQVQELIEMSAKAMSVQVICIRTSAVNMYVFLTAKSVAVQAERKREANDELARDAPEKRLKVDLSAVDA